MKLARSVWVCVVIAASCTLLGIGPGCLTLSGQDKTASMQVQRIWADSSHHAFTDLIQWQDQLICTFRSGAGHVPRNNNQNGVIRLIRSTDGDHWKEFAVVAEPGVDLRDPKLSLTPDGRLMLLMGGSVYHDGQLEMRGSRVAFLEPGAREFSAVTPVRLEADITTGNDWLWRVTWQKGIGYGVVYQAVDDRPGLQLVSTTNGIDYRRVAELKLTGRPNESTIRFDPLGVMHVVVRNETGSIGHLGIAQEPFEQFQWSRIGMRLGGPNMIQLPDGKWILGTRYYSNPAKTVLARLEDDGQCQVICELPSGGDTSYPGLLLHADELWVSYYSSHEGSTAIYLARVPLAQLE